VSWYREFDDPIPLPRGRQFVTLEGAGNYITKLPKAEHAAPEWQDAMEALMLVATRPADHVVDMSQRCKERPETARSGLQPFSGPATVAAVGSPVRAASGVT
jgi:hypothetical protein